MSLTIRPYVPEDRPACAGVFYRAVREGAAAFYDEDQRAAWAPSPDPDAHAPDKLLDQWCWVAQRGDRIVGFMSLDRTGYLDMAFVLPEEMGRGTSTALYGALMAQARTARLTRLTVTASHLARRFFQKKGWRISWMQNLVADGQVYEVFRMFLDLPGRADG
jgi:putative acetyltransferase